MFYYRILTALRILNGPGRELQVEEENFKIALLHLIPRIIFMNNHHHAQIHSRDMSTTEQSSILNLNEDIIISLKEKAIQTHPIGLYS